MCQNNNNKTNNNNHIDDQIKETIQKIDVDNNYPNIKPLRHTFFPSITFT